jgi:cell division protein FtsI/penicillin-binding protein 2
MNRARFVVTVFGVAWTLLALRLVHLQWWQQVGLAGRAERQREYAEEITARPGDIVDRQGRLVATTLTLQSLYVVPSRISNVWTTANALAGALDLKAEELFERIGERRDRHFLWVKRRLSSDEVDKVRHLDLPAGSWGFRDEYRREYPQGVVAAHVLGLRDIDGVGRGGVEEAMDHVLSGEKGRRKLARDSRGRVIEILDDIEQPSRQGQMVQLSVDLVVQLFAERELDAIMSEWKPESCSAIAIDPKTGDVLAMATRPSFDPNHPELAAPEEWKNRAIADIYEPGSTFKPFVVGYGLDQQVLHKTDMFDCENGLYKMGRRLLHDHHRYGTLSLTDVLVKSSNIGMAKIGERLTNERLFEAATLFGFGQKTGIELPGELSGILRPLKEWTGYSTGSIPMGHELATTPLQLISAHAALANGGLLLRPRIILPHTGDSTAAVRQIRETTVRPDVARWLVEVPMQEVVTRGTGKRARIPGYNVFGKTGTAQCISPNGGYLHGKYISSFVCGAPVDDPRLLVLVVVNQSSVGGETFGGRVAAPAAANILKQALVYLRIAPDQHLLHAASNAKDDPPE